jgi:hypothetical protein
VGEMAYGVSELCLQYIMDILIASNLAKSSLTISVYPLDSLSSPF